MNTPSTDRIAWLCTQIGQHFSELGRCFRAPAPSAKPIAEPAKRSRGRPPKTEAERANGKKNFTDGVMTAITTAGKRGITKENLMALLTPGMRANHVGVALARHLRGGRIVELHNGRFCATAKITPTIYVAQLGDQPSA